MNGAYGYLWWENAKPGRSAGGMGEGQGYRFPGSPHDVFAALGAGGQVVLIAPSLDLVVIRQGRRPGPTMLPRLLASVCAAAGYKA